jgi:1-deoxyxylulose-5-phosphate synthase
VVEVAKRKAVPPIHVALAWLLGKPGIAAPIVSATMLDQLDQLVAGMSVSLTPDEVRAVEEPYQPHPVLGIE